MMSFIKKISFLIVLCNSVILHSQNSKVLESKREVIEKQIDLTNQILEKTKRNKTSTIHDFKAIQSQIKNRQNLISNIRSELDSTETFIKDSKTNIDLLENNVNSLESKYNQVLRAAYRQKLTQNTLLQLLSAKSLKDALLRWRYTKQFEQYCKKQIALLHRSKSNLKQSIDTVLAVQELKKSLLEEESEQNEILGSELNQKNKLIKSLESNERKLYAELSKQRDQKTKMDQSISQIITGYVPKGQNSTPIASQENTRNETVSTFAENKGFLSWPVKEGFISNRFGKQKHPTLRDIEIDNNGIDIRTKTGAITNAVYNGIVVGKSFIPGNYNVLVIRHGEYLTVYSRLEEVYVEKGEGIYSGQEIGKVVSEDGVSVLHFEVWNNKQKENPENWIQKK